jgi:hypothetical protein
MPEQADEIKRNGLRITHHQGEEPFTVRPRALHLTEVQQMCKGAKIGLAARANERRVDIITKAERGKLWPDPHHITELRLN